MDTETINPPGTSAAENKSGTPASRLLQKSDELKRRGTPPGAKRGPYNKGDKPSPSQSAPAQGPLFNEQNFGRLVGIPFDFMAVKTGIGNWSLDDQEKKELAVSGVPCFNEWVGVNPKWASLAIFSLSLIAISAQKAMAYAAYLRMLEEQRRAASDEAKRRANMAEVPAGTPAPLDPKAGTSPLLPVPNVKA